VTLALLGIFVGLLVLVLAHPDLATRMRVKYHAYRLGSEDGETRRDAASRLLEIGRPAIDEVYPEVVATRVRLVATDEARDVRVFVGRAASREQFDSFPASTFPGGTWPQEIEILLREDVPRPKEWRNFFACDTPWYVSPLTARGRRLYVTRPQATRSRDQETALVVVPLDGEPEAEAIIEAVKRSLMDQAARKP
jgi:hypothetical protein